MTYMVEEQGFEPWYATCKAAALANYAIPP